MMREAKKCEIRFRVVCAIFVQMSNLTGLQSGVPIQPKADGTAASRLHQHSSLNFFG